MPSASLFQSMRRLACFAAIADAGSIKGGAQRLGLSDPVVSTALTELEQELSVKLAIRTTRNLQLTEAGTRVYGHAQQMLVSADAALENNSTNTKIGGELRITLPVELCTKWLPTRLFEFHQLYPDIKLQVDADDILVPLHSSEYDLAIQANYKSPHEQVSDDPGENLRTLGTINLVCVAAKKPKIHWSGTSATMNIPLIELKHRSNRLIARDKKQSKAVTLGGSQIIRTNNHESALALVRAGLGAVMMMEDSVKQLIASKELVRIMPSFDFGHLQLDAKTRDSLPSPAAKVFIRFLGL